MALRTLPTKDLTISWNHTNVVWTIGVGYLLLGGAIIVLVWDVPGLREVMAVVALFLLCCGYLTLKGAILAWLGKTAGLSEEEFVERMTAGRSDGGFRQDVRQLLRQAPRPRRRDEAQ